VLLARLVLSFVQCTKDPLFSEPCSCGCQLTSMKKKSSQLHTAVVLTSLNYSFRSRAFLPGAAHRCRHSSIHTPSI